MGDAILWCALERRVKLLHRLRIVLPIQSNEAERRMELAFKVRFLLIPLRVGKICGFRLAKELLHSIQSFGGKAAGFVHRRLLRSVVLGKPFGNRCGEHDHRVQVIGFDSKNLISIFNDLVKIVGLLRGDHRVGIGKSL